MVKHTQTIRQLWQTNCLGVFDHSVGLALIGEQTYLNLEIKKQNYQLVKYPQNECTSAVS